MSAVRRALLFVVILGATFSGCIANGDDEPTPTTGDLEEPPAAEPGLFEGPESVELIFTTVWAGNSGLDEPVVIPRDYDYLLQEISNNGQIFGHPTYTGPDGTVYDDGTLSAMAGTFSYLRLLPGDAGNGRLTMTGAMAGTGTSTVFAVDNVTPMVLLALGWSGQRIDTPVIDTQIVFYVPETLGDLQIDLTGTGQSVLGIHVTDANGERVAALENLPGSNASTARVPATPGMWTIHLQGAMLGAWTAVVGVAP